MAIYRKGRNARDFDTGVQRALEALLSSPKFVLRVEQDRPSASTAAYRLSVARTLTARALADALARASEGGH